MAGLNQVQLIGHLGRDPEVRTTQGGEKMASISVATSESWKDKNSGEWKEKTEWHKVVIYAEHAANYAERHLRKGSMVYVQGALQTRKWTDNAGVEKYTTEIVLQKFRGVLEGLDKRERDDGGESSGGGYSTGGGDDRGQLAGGSASRAQAPAQARRSGPPVQDLDDEIPF